MVEYNPDIELVVGGETDLGHTLADRVLEENEFFKIEKIAEHMPSPREERYIEYYKEFKKLGLNPEDNFRDVAVRKRLTIKHFGYTRLNSENNMKKRYSECTSEKTCLASNNLYKTGEKICKKYNSKFS